MPGPHAATYYATKNYVLALSEGIAQEVDQFGVTVSALCPGPVATGFQDRSGQGESLVKGPLVMQADEVARIGWKLFRGGRRVIVPGFGNKALTQLPRIVPRGLITRMMARVQDI
jgi:short-subunit dehydrogenase